MKGRFVELRLPVKDDDFVAIAEVVRPLTPTAVLAGDSELVTAEDVRLLNAQGKIRHFIVDTLDGRTIGTVSWRSVGTPGGYSIGSAVRDPDNWGRGYGAEATQLLIDYLFHTCNAHRVEMTTALFNKHSVRVMTGNNFVLEGILRRRYFLDGEYHDAAMWSMLRDEYYAMVRAAKARSPKLDVVDLVPAEDKSEAKRLLARYLNRGGASSVAMLAATDDVAEVAS